MTAERNLRLFSVLSGFFVASLLVANATSSKLVILGPLILPGGIFIIPLSFIFGDVLTEVYGYHLSRKIIWTAFGCQILAAIVYWLVGVLPPAPVWTDQAAYDRILGFIPRVVAGSIVAFFFGEFCNSWILSKMKFHADGKRGLWQGWRFMASTVVGEAVDTAIVSAIVFGGVLPLPILVRTAISVYVVKVVYEIVALPLSIPFANWVKRVENVDHIDTPETTNYSPFALGPNQS